MSRPLHILYVSEGWPPETDARAMRVFYHSRHWAKLGQRITVLTKTPNHPYGKVYSGYRNRWLSVEETEGVEVRRIWSWLAPAESALKRLIAALSFTFSAVIHSFPIKKVDIVIGTSPTPFAALTAYIISKIKGVPFIFEARDVWPETLQKFSRRRSHRFVVWLMRKLVHYLYHKAAMIVCVTQGQIPIICENYHIAPAKVRLIPNGAELSTFQIKGVREAQRREQGWENYFIVMFAGYHGHTHNITFMADVAKRMRGVAHIRFVLIGEGCQKPALKQFKQDHQLENIVFYDQQPSTAIPAFYEAADLCFIPLHSQFPYDHAMPVKMYESMAMGLPVLLAGQGEAVATIATAHAGMSISPNDIEGAASAIMELSTNTEQLLSCKQKGRAFIEQHYTREKAATDLLRLMEQLCPEK